MSRLAFADAALSDLAEIGDYILTRSKSHEASRKWLARLLDECVSIANNPGVGTLQEDVSLGLRMRPVKDYNIYFRHLPEHSEVRILRIVHAARDPMNVFGP
jgi:plasmid stabilization system protein ParE